MQREAIPGEEEVILEDSRGALAGIFLLPEEGIVGSKSVNGCPGYGGGTLGSEEEHDLGDLFRANESWKQVSPGYVFHHPGFGRAGTDGIDIDAILLHLCRQAVGELKKSRFRRPVRAPSGRAISGPDGGDIDDLARTLLDHCRQHSPGTEKRTAQVYLLYPIPLRQGQVYNVSIGKVRPGISHTTSGIAGGLKYVNRSKRLKTVSHHMVA